MLTLGRRGSAAAHASVVARQLLSLVAGCGAAAVVGMWWRHTPTDPHTANAVVLDVARLSGLLAGYGAVILVALMARIDPIERWVGTGQLAQLHASWGRLTLSLVAVHVSAVCVAYAGLTRVAVAREAWLLTRDYPYVWLAALAAAAMAVAGAVSVGALRRAVTYRVWFRVHLILYAAVAAAVGHQVAVGTDFAHDGATRAVWIGMYLAVTAAVGYYRVARPVVVAVRSQARVLGVHRELGDVVSLEVSGAGLLRPRPGQFFRLRFLTSALWREAHPFSVSAVPAEKSLRFTIKARGPHTHALQGIACGTRVALTGPYGAASLNKPGKALLVAGGIGITPLRALFESLSSDGVAVTMLYRTSSAAQLTFRAELDAISQDTGAVVHYLVGSRNEPGNSLEPARLQQLVPDLLERQVFVCAPVGMMRTVSASLRAAGVPAAQIRWESFDLAEATWPGRARAGTVAVLSVGVLSAVAAYSDLPGRQVRTPVLARGPVVVPDQASDGTGTVTVDGPVERTLYNSVQVRIVVSHGHLVNATAVMLPDVDARSRQLSAMAAPILRREALASDGARIDVVSGATFTSGAYAQSLQAALDQARS